MQKRAWIRYGLCALTMAGVTGGVLTGCDDDDAPPATPATDAGADQAAADATTVVPDAAPDAGPVDVAKLVLVHASPDFPPFRVCFSVLFGEEEIVAPLPALPDSAMPGQPFPAIFPGTGGPMPDVKDLEKDAITTYLIFADRIKDEVNVDGGTQAKCSEFIDTTGAGGPKVLKENVDYVKLPRIPANTFLHGKTFIIGLTGCVPASADAGTNTAKCGADYDPTKGNIAAKFAVVDRKAPADATAMGAQFIHLSQPLQAAVPPGVVPVFETGATTTPIAGVVKFGETAPTEPTPVTGVDVATTKFGIATPLEDGGVGPVLGSAPLPLVQTATIGSAEPANYFHPGASYAFVLVGDPEIKAVDENGNFNGRGLHFLGFMSDPVLPTR